MKFDWDPKKAEAIWRKTRRLFDEAATTFLDPHAVPARIQTINWRRKVYYVWVLAAHAVTCGLPHVSALVLSESSCASCNAKRKGKFMKKVDDDEMRRSYKLPTLRSSNEESSMLRW